ncbi:MAG: hypothetical protein JNM21_02335 [Taibaiella sp.]|nr:hypothetical protein [Taibaiella sp.]
MNYRLILKILLLSLLMIAGHHALQAQTVVMGKVLDETDRMPVDRAIIIIGKDTTYTDSLGAFIAVNKEKAKELLVLTNDYAPQTVQLSDSNEYALTILLTQEVQKYVKDKDLKGKEIDHVDRLSAGGNDTSHFAGVQGRFAAYILNAKTREPLDITTIYMKETEDGTISDSTGYFEILFDGERQTIVLDALGFYVKDTLVSNIGQAPPDTIYLEPLPGELDGVTVYGRKKRYRNKNNPAVALMRKVIDRKAQNRMVSGEDAKYEVYDKMVLYISNVPRIITRNFFFKKLRVIFENEDTTMIPKRKLVPMYVTETLADHYYSKANQKEGRQLTSEKRIRFDSRLIESRNISSFLDRLYDQIDIYDDKIRVLNNFFLSPIAPAAPTFYKFFIVDTNVVDGQQIVQLRFEPRNTNDFLFEGRIYVTLGPDYAVTKVNMKVPKKTPLNWTSGLDINLGFTRQENGKYWQTSSNYLVNFGLFNSKRGVVGVRYVDKSNYQANPVIPDTVFTVKQQTTDAADTLYEKPDQFWEAERPFPLSHVELKAYRNIDSLRETRMYKNMMKTMYIVATGHVPTKYIEFGSIYDVVSYNPIEGVKFRAGGRTNITTIPNLFLQGYASYGLRDKRLKYYLGGTVALNGKYAFGFPRHNLSLSYQYDVRSPGQQLGFVTAEKPVDLIRRGDNNRYLYNRLFTFLYTKEFQNRMTLNLGYNNWQQEAAGSLYFQRANGTQDTIRNLSTNEFSLNWRYSPGEKFIQNRRQRSYMENQAWVFNLKLTAGFNEGYADNVIDYQKLEAKIEKRFFFPPFGQAYVFLTGGYLLGEVPYPYLFIPQANQSYRYSIGSYNLMNFMEFASDRYVGLTIDYHMKGFLLSRIPLVKKMYLREVASFKVLYGDIRKNNLPQYNPDLLQFPVNDKGESIVNSFGRQPYIEASVGVENVLKVLRIDFVKRFTYTDLPLVAPWGIRFSFGADF